MVGDGSVRPMVGDGSAVPMSTVVVAPSHLSYSSLSSWTSCGEKYRLSYVEHVPKIPQGALLGGRAIHEAIEESERGGWWEREDAHEPEGPIALQYITSLKTAVAVEVLAGKTIRWGGRG